MSVSLSGVGAFGSGQEYREARMVTYISIDRSH